jgi:hypothetical protein
MKALSAVLRLGTFIAALACLESVNAMPARQTVPASTNMNPTRERAIRKCMEMQRQYPNEAFFGIQHYHYRACMAQHGQPE